MDPLSPAHVALGKEIKRLRLSLDLSQETLADRAGVHTNYIGMLERGERNVALRNLIRIATALEVPASQIVAATDGVTVDPTDATV